MEQTLVLIKPDAVRAHHIGDITKAYEEAGLKIRAMKMMQMTDRIARIHYEEHLAKPFYGELSAFMTGAPLVAMVLAGENAIARVRELHGATNPANAAEGTIRKRFAKDGSENAVHASDSPESAAREIHIFFSETEIF
ncbi:nucleoside-diphosphate kinase [Selenomonas noxia]|uniref:nucleoside-diphosphate kinase n=1 Tax=Selenomonas noxia TaxID=135083 RepID=UPI003C717FE3